MSNLRLEQRLIFDQRKVVSQKVRDIHHFHRCPDHHVGSDGRIILEQKTRRFS